MGRLHCRFESYQALLNKHMTTTEFDATIYIEQERENQFRVRYEFRISIAPNIQEQVRQRLLKSFSLGRNFPDARTIPAARQKGRLMQTLLKNSFGYTSNIVEVFKR